jgi:chromosome partitioning protein
MIIAVLNEKGGVGKTTLVTNLARAFQQPRESDERRVLLVDSDTQGSLRDWHAAAGESGNYPAVIAMDKPSMIRELPRMAEDYDVVLIDGCPKAIGMIAAGVMVSDVVLIPVQPSGLDLWAVNSVVDLVKQRREVTAAKPKAAIVMTRQITNTKLAGESRVALAELGLPIFTGTTQRIAYAVAAGNGSTVLDGEYAGTAAALEIKTLSDDVWRIANHG